MGHFENKHNNKKKKIKTIKKLLEKSWKLFGRKVWEHWNVIFHKM